MSLSPTPDEGILKGVLRSRDQNLQRSVNIRHALNNEKARQRNLLTLRFIKILLEKFPQDKSVNLANLKKKNTHFFLFLVFKVFYKNYLQNSS